MADLSWINKLKPSERLKVLIEVLNAPTEDKWTGVKRVRDYYVDYSSYEVQRLLCMLTHVETSWSNNRHLVPVAEEILFLLYGSQLPELEEVIKKFMILDQTRIENVIRQNPGRKNDFEDELKDEMQYFQHLIQEIEQKRKILNQTRN